MGFEVVVTGAGGVLGRHLVRVLQSRGRGVRGLGRGPSPPGFTAPWARVDLADAAALGGALRGGDVVVHAASDPLRRSGDVHAAQALALATRQAGVAHIFYVQIAGLGADARRVSRYYRDKTRAEEVLRNGPVPCATVAATQFNSLMDRVFTALSVGPFLPRPRFTLQPVDPAFVAERIADHLEAQSTKGLTICGPQLLSSRDMTAAWIATQEKRVLSLPIPAFGLLAGFSHIERASGVAGGLTWWEWLKRAKKSP